MKSLQGNGRFKSLQASRQVNDTCNQSVEFDERKNDGMLVLENLQRET